MLGAQLDCRRQTTSCHHIIPKPPTHARRLPPHKTSQNAALLNLKALRLQQLLHHVQMVSVPMPVHRQLKNDVKTYLEEFAPWILLRGFPRGRSAADSRHRRALIERITPTLRDGYQKTDQQINTWLNEAMKPGNGLRTHTTGGVEVVTPTTTMFNTITTTTQSNGGICAELQLDEHFKSAIRTMAEMINAYDGTNEWNPKVAERRNIRNQREVEAMIRDTLSNPIYKLGVDATQSRGSCRQGVDLLLRPNFSRGYAEHCADVADELYRNNGNRNLAGNPLSLVARTNARHMRLESGLTAYMALHGAIQAIQHGKAIPVLNRGRPGGDILVPLPGKLEKEGPIWRPICVGAWFRDKRTAQQFLEEGPFFEIQYTGCIYFVGLISCHVYVVWSRKELRPQLFAGKDGPTLLSTVVDIGNGYFMGRLQVPTMASGKELPTYYYHLADQTTQNHKYSIHLLMGLAKRTIDIDPRGRYVEAALKEMGFVVRNDAGEIIRVMTPEEAFPIRRLHEYDVDPREDHLGEPIHIADQSETSDQEHGNGRLLLTDNNAFAIRDTNHSRNCVFTIVCSHEMEGTGYTNFAHTRIVYDRYDHGQISGTRARDVRAYSLAHRSRRRTTARR